MSYLVLARKWRPQTFADVVGQEHVTRTLRNAITSGRVAHAFLFTGPRGVGKTTTARLLAKALNCEQGPTPDPCNTCSNCLEITAGNALDVLEIDGASHTGVDNIRDLTDGIQYRPVKSRFRVIIIDEVHMLSNAAFNALLKTLEEPPAHVKFIFATTESHKILQTIQSRCQRYDFKRIALRELIRQLRLIVDQEQLTADDGGLALLAREADGSLRDAESLLDQVVTWSTGAVTEQGVRDALGVADRQALFRVVEAILKQDAAESLRLAGDLYQYGYDPRRLCRDLLEHFRHLVAAKISTDPALLTDLPDHEVATVRQQASLRSLEDLQRCFTLMLRTEEDINHTIYVQLVIEMALVKLASQPPVMPLEDALAQLEALRNSLSGDPQEPPPPMRRAPQPVPSSISSPPAPTPTVKESPAPLRSVAAPVKIETESSTAWEGFLKAVQKEKISLFFALKSGYCLNETATSLQIGIEKDPYFKELIRKENHILLKDIAQRFFGRPMTIEVVKSSAPITMTRDTSQPQAIQDPIVSTVLEVLGGEVQTVRSPRP